MLCILGLVLCIRRLVKLKRLWSSVPVLMMHSPEIYMDSMLGRLKSQLLTTCSPKTIVCYSASSASQVCKPARCVLMAVAKDLASSSCHALACDHHSADTKMKKEYVRCIISQLIWISSILYAHLTWPWQNGGKTCRWELWLYLSLNIWWKHCPNVVPGLIQ